MPPNQPGVPGSLASNTVTTEVLSDLIKKVMTTDKTYAKEGEEVVKSVDKAFAVKGETLTYTVTFTNKGNININDIYFTDNIPQGTTFVNGSVKINDQIISAYRPDVGYSVANLPPNDSATTSFKVTID